MGMVEKNAVILYGEIKWKIFEIIWILLNRSHRRGQVHFGYIYSSSVSDEIIIQIVHIHAWMTKWLWAKFQVLTQHDEDVFKINMNYPFSQYELTWFQFQNGSWFQFIKALISLSLYSIILFSRLFYFKWFQSSNFVLFEENIFLKNIILSESKTKAWSQSETIFVTRVNKYKSKRWVRIAFSKMCVRRSQSKFMLSRLSRLIDCCHHVWHDYW